MSEGNWTLWGGSLEDREFPAVTAFFDESGHPASTRVVAMGGAMSGPKQWEELRVKWKAALGKQGVEVFHMTDFENRQGEFSGWNETRKRELLSELIGSLDMSLFFLIGAAVVVQDFNRVTYRGHKKFFNFFNPWYFCYQCCFEAALDPYFLIDPKYAGVDKEVAHIRACFFEAHREYTWGPALFALARERHRQRSTRHLDGIIGWGTKHASVNFQFADLIAYELRKHVENAVFRGERPTRWPMKQLLKNPFTVNVLDDSQTVIPTEPGGFALFRSASSADFDESGRVKFNAQGISR